MFTTRRTLTSLASRISIQTCTKPTPLTSFPVRSFAASTKLTMPEPLKPEEVNSKTDPSVSKQFDTEASLDTKTKDLYAIIDGLKIGMLGTYRPGVGVSPPPTLPVNPIIN